MPPENRPPAGPVAALEPARLRNRCDPDALAFTTTAELADLPEILGQPRASEALSFGVGIRRDGFHLFALGPVQVGVHETVRRFLAARAAREAKPQDWVYVHDFEQPHRPQALALPAGRGTALSADMAALVTDLRVSIPAAFETDEYRARAHVIEEEIKERHEAAFGEIEKEARERQLAFVRTPMGMGFVPMKGDEAIGAQDFAKLPAEERDRISKAIAEMQEKLQTAVADLPQAQREALRLLRELNREFASHAVGSSIAEVRDKYRDLPDVLTYLDGVASDLVERIDQVRRGEGGPAGAPGMAPHGGGPGMPGALLAAGMGEPEGSPLDRFRVNVLVDRSSSQGAPVIYEPHPTYPNLVGRVEHRPALGTLVTDFTLIKPGALHQANGGYLILDARRVLSQPYAWEGLKQALKGNRIRIESLGQVFSAISTVTLEPEPIPLDVKVVLVDEPMVYFTLHRLDPELGELFKVVVDFDDRMPRTDETTQMYARFVAQQARTAGLRPLDRGAVALLIEHGSRLASDAERLSTLGRSLVDLLAEADYWAGARSRDVILADDVQEALDAARRRVDRVRERMLEETTRGTILVDTDGERAGQINGLAVYQIGDHAFGRPSRITARVRIGSGQVIDIEREVQLGGPLHSKGVLILSSWLASRFADDIPLSLSASLVFEQSYGGIDGDSASAAELWALLSALAELPIQQSFAVTGSVNQLGEVQAIGGVNEKIEGFFDLCQARGLTGRQGVLIPVSNVKHLMLRPDVLAAAEAGRFAVYPITTIDEGIELLTGTPAGVAAEDGVFPEGTVNRRIADRLRAFAERRQKFGEPAKAGSGDKDGEEKPKDEAPSPDGPPPPGGPPEQTATAKGRRHG